MVSESDELSLPMMSVCPNPQGPGTITPFAIGIGDLANIVQSPSRPGRFVFHNLPGATVRRVACEICEAYERLQLECPILEELY